MKTAVLSLLGAGLMLCAFGIAYLRESGTIPSPMGFLTEIVGFVQPAAKHFTFPGGDSGQQPGELLLYTGNLLQNPELPNGCEATSLAILLRYHGFYTDNIEIAYSYLPREDFGNGAGGRTGPDPTVAYAGDPASATGGYYCFASAVRDGANSYLAGQYTSLCAQDISGISLEGLEGWLQGGSPVAVWVTRDYGPAECSETGWTLPSGEWYTPYHNLHCVVLVGYTSNDVLLCDPLQDGVTSAPREMFEQAFEALGRQAVVIA